MHDPVGPAVGSLPHASMDVLARIAASAAQTDAEGVPRVTIDALASAGLLGTPLSPVSAARELAEVLAGCDATTWFCWVQHISPMHAIAAAVDGPETPAASTIRERYLSGLRSGELLAGVAFAHVRRPGPPNPVATRDADGWRVNGTLDWVTSWDIADVVVVTAKADGPDEGMMIAFVLPAGHSTAPLPDGVSVGDPLRLLAMSGTHTRPVRFDNVAIPATDVIALTPVDSWMADDRQRTADANPSAFGLARAAIAELDELAAQRNDSLMRVLATDLASQCRDMRAQAYALMEDADREGTRVQRLDLRAQALDLATRAAMANVTARAGASMMTGCSAERRLRESMFLLVQAQTADTRAASLRLEIAAGGKSSASSGHRDDRT